MSNLLKSKFLLGVMVVATMLLAVVAVDAGKAEAASCSTFTMTLKYGQRNSQVLCLQQMLNERGYHVDGTGAGSAGQETTYFGNATKTAVKAFQSANNLTPDGVFGPMSRQALLGSVVVNPGALCPNGMTSASNCTLPPSGTSTGPLCPNGMTVASNCTQSGGVVINNGPVSVSLATNNPAAGTLVATQATADLAHFTFTGSGTVTGVTLQRIGVSGDSTLSNVYLFDGATRLTDSATVANNGQITFNNPSGLFTVNGSKTISVKSDILTGTSGQTVGVRLATFTTASGTVNANISGNIHTIASSTLAAVSAGTVTPSGATLNPGANVTVWQSTLNVSNRDVWMKRLALRNVGSAPASAFQNFKLFVNGVQVGTASGLDINGYVTFDLNANPVLLVAGSRIVRVDADIVSGASRTVQFSLRQAADVDFVDSNFLVNVAPTSTPWAPSSASTISGASGGTLTIEKDVSSPSTALVVGANDVNLGTFKATAYGEAIKIETLTGGFTYTDAGTVNAVASLRNGRILISTDGVNWVQYGSTATLLAAGTSYTLNYTVMPGTPIWIQLHADVYDNDGSGSVDASDSLVAKLLAGSSNATRQDSLGSFAAPAAAVSANTRDIDTATMTLSQNATYAAQNTTLPAPNFKIGSFNLAGSSVEDILLTTLSVDVTAVTGTPDFGAGDITNMYVVVKNSSGAILAQPAPIGTVSATDNNFSVGNVTLAKNQNLTVEIYGNLASDGSGTIDAADSFKTILTITGTSLVSGQTVTAGDGSTTIAGQIIAYAAATVTVSKDASSPVTGIVYDNQTVTTLAAKFATVTAPYNLTGLTVTVGASANTVVQNVMLYDGANLIATAPLTTSTTAVFSGLSWSIPANTSKVLTVKLQLGTVGAFAGTTGSTITTSIAAATDAIYTNTSTGVSTTASTEEAGTATGSAMYVYAAIPTITKVPLTDTVLRNGEKVLLKFTVTANGGDISWGYLFFDTTHDTDTALATDATTGVSLWDTASNTVVAGVFTNTTNIVGGVDPTGSIKFVPTVEQVVSGSKTYELRGTITSANADGDFVTVTIANDSSAVVASDQLTDIDADTDAPIIWSDMSAASHATTTDDWTSDFGVRFLPISDSLNF